MTRSTSNGAGVDTVATNTQDWLAHDVMDSYAGRTRFITLGAAIVNGALGYGFSSITVPIALLFLTNRVLNPALVPIEVALNAYVLWVNRGRSLTFGDASSRSSSAFCPECSSAPRSSHRSTPVG